MDASPPVIRIDDSVAQPWYRTTGEALAALQRAIHVTDGCEDVTVEAPVLTGSCGSVIGSVRAADTCGNMVTQQTVLHVDGAPPTIVIPASLASQCFPSLDAAEQAIRNQTMISDDCTPPQDIHVTMEASVTDCSPRIRVHATDKAGRHSSAAVTVHVDSTPPRVTIDRLLLGFKSEVLGFQTPRCYRSTAEAEAAVLAVSTATDGCTPAAGMVLTATSSGNPCALHVTVRGADACGLAATDSVDVRVDVTAPVVSCAVVTNRLTPADKRMVDVGFTWSVNDSCDPALAPVITVTSDEPTWAAGASPAPDAEIRRDAAGVVRFVRLRAEAATGGNGRVYRINVQATDSCGNTGSNAVLVTVPNPSNLAVDSGQYYDATAVN